MTQAFQTITVAIEGRVALLTLNLPDKLNGLAATIQGEIVRAIAELEEQGEVRALIITGAGRAFSAGADLADMLAVGDGQAQAEHTYKVMLEHSNPMIKAVRRSPMAIVAAVNGIAAGAGASLALACDVVVAARSAGFLMPFIPRLGIVPDLGATWVLPRAIGEARARAVMLLGDKIGAEQAAQWGMIWSCVEDAELMSAAHGLASRLAAAPRHATAELKAALVCAEYNSLDEQLQYEAERQLDLVAREEFQEAIQAFLSKRPAVFK